MYDLIGDIHGHADELESLLHKLGYVQRGSCYSHSERTAIFLGDFIDRGPHQRRVLETVQAMVESGAAMAIMGNHEFNAIGFHTLGEDGLPLRQHSEKNIRQHRAFLDEFASDPMAMNRVVDWFKTLPLWLDLDEFRVVHACWKPELIHKIRKTYGPVGCLNDLMMYRACQNGTWEHDAVEVLLKGVEVDLPHGYTFFDKDGNSRSSIRIKWWLGETNHQDAYIGPSEVRSSIPKTPLRSDEIVEYSAEEKPVFIGHYWLQDDPEPLTMNVCCLDYSVAKTGGALVAYRWQSDGELSPKHYVVQKRRR